MHYTKTSVFLLLQMTNPEQSTGNKQHFSARYKHKHSENLSIKAKENLKGQFLRVFVILNKKTHKMSKHFRSFVVKATILDDEWEPVTWKSPERQLT